VSDTFPRNRSARRAGLPVFLVLLAAAFFLSGCPAASTRLSFSAAEEELLEARGDTALRDAVREGGKEPFAAVAVFRRDAFLGQSAMLDRASIPLLNEFGNAAILLLQPDQVLPLLKDPSVRRLAWFGPQGRLARLDPSLELDLLGRYSSGSEGRAAQILARFRSVPGETEERQVTAAGFRILYRGGPNLLVSGPWSGVPRLLGIERVIYLEKGAGPEEAGVPGGKTTKELPHSKESVSDIKERDAKEPPPSRGEVSIPFRSYPRGDNDAAPPQPAPGNGGSR
jgi:hypothetical protein